MLPDLSTIPHHPAIEEIVDVLCSKTQEQDRGFFRAEVAYFLGKAAAAMRATVVTQIHGEIPVNIYTIALAESGFGKGHSVGIVENQILREFKTRFMEDTLPVIAEQNLWVIANTNAAKNGNPQQEEFDKLEKEFKRLGEYPFTFDSGSTPAIKELRTKLLMGGIGSINMQIDEIGSNLIGQQEALTTFLELYDQGMVKLKLKMNTPDQKRSVDYDGKTPTNMLLFGTPAALFDSGPTEQAFHAMLETGYARRCLFGYGVKNTNKVRPTAEELYKVLSSPSNAAALDKWTAHFYKLADPARYNWKAEVSEDVGIMLVEYKLSCEDKAAAMPDHDFVRKAEMAHRYFKTLKLAGAYAFVDDSPFVEMDHLFAAIKLVEESGQSFHAILNREEGYMKLAKYIAQAPGEVTHPDLDKALPFYKGGQAKRNEMMTMAVAWGYKNHIIIQKSFADGVELFKGESLKETDLNKITLSYSTHWAYEYLSESVPFDKLNVLTQAEGMHWANHHFKNGHRAEDNVIAGFNMITIDVDGGVSLATAHELMEGYKFMTYTTKRHTPQENRFRLMIPINYELKLDQEEYKEFMNSVLQWLPFPTDESANQRSKKWESFHGGAYHFNPNPEAQLLDALPFIPKTTRHEEYKQQSKELGSLDNMERWFATRIASGNRNNQMIKYALALVDSGWDLPSVRTQVHAFNKKLKDSMTEAEIDSTILVTIGKKFALREVA